MTEELFHGLADERAWGEELADHVLYGVRWLVAEPGHPGPTATEARRTGGRPSTTSAPVRMSGPSINADRRRETISTDEKPFCRRELYLHELILRRLSLQSPPRHGLDTRTWSADHRCRPRR